jgi:hypothetical protein
MMTMSLFKNHLLISLAGMVIFLVLGFGIYQIRELRIAHSTFENYYAFRGCVQLIDRTDTYGDCKLASGQAIKIVLINGRWYLDGDGPGIW